MRKLKCCIVGTILVLLIIAGFCAYLFVKSLLSFVCVNHISPMSSMCRTRLQCFPHFRQDSVNRILNISSSHLALKMPGRSFTKQERRLFYINLVVVIIGVAISCLWSVGVENVMLN